MAEPQFLDKGIHRIPMARYLADPCEKPSLSNSVAQVLIVRSPLHARAAHPRLNEKYISREATKFDIGTAAHSLLLEGDDVAAVIDAPDWRTNSAKQQRDEARKAGKVPLLAEQYSRVRAMVGVARTFIAGCELAPLFEGADAELTMIWRHGRLWMRARPDWWSKNRKAIIHYKTTENAEPEFFSRLMPRLGYDLTALFYEDGAQDLGFRAESYFLAQETEPPYSCSLHALDPAMRDIARGKFLTACKLWDACTLNNDWPAYTTQVCYATPSTWEIDQHEERMLEMKDEEAAA